VVIGRLVLDAIRQLICFVLGEIFKIQGSI